MVPRTSHPELHMLAMASSSNAQGLAVTGGRGVEVLMVFGKWRSLEHMEWRFVSKRLFSWLSLPFFPALALREMWCPEVGTSPP